MHPKDKLAIVALLLFTSFSVSFDVVPDYGIERHQEVAMRMIGHQMLLHSGDSTSKVLPIERNENQFTISFDKALSFHPSILVDVVDSMIDTSNLANHYIVEVLSCDSSLVVYSYEVFDDPDFGIIPCGNREYEKQCYQLQITLMDPILEDQLKNTSILPSDESTSGINPGVIILVFASVLLLGYIAFTRKKKDQELPAHLVGIGGYHFDPRNMSLIFEDREMELTSKESDLLNLLYQEVNQPVEREVILNKVWGDEGDYVGRTLDVFISKLRKKLQSDPNIKIMNIRGVGYKMVINEIVK